MGCLFFKKGRDRFTEEKEQKLEDINVTDIDGTEKKLGEYIDNKKAIVFVNTASSCGYTTSNYRELVELFEKYKDNGLQVLGFPCNQFMGQESKCEVDIKSYVKNKFKVT